MPAKSTPSRARPKAKAPVRAKAAPKKSLPATVRIPRADTSAGEQIFLLNVPYAERQLAQAAGAVWYPDHGWAYVGTTLPASLTRYDPPPYSWESYLADRNGLLQTQPFLVCQFPQQVSLTLCVDNRLYRYCENAIARIRVSPEGQEGLRAFLQKRTPRWQTDTSTQEPRS